MNCDRCKTAVIKHADHDQEDHGNRGLDPKAMTPGQINRELDRLDKESSKITDQLIAAGRGSERPSETRTKTDPLATEWKRVADRQYELHSEIKARYGQSISRLPTGRGFGPRIKKYSEDQPRDEGGRWSSSGGGGTATKEPKDESKSPYEISFGIRVAISNNPEAWPGKRGEYATSASAEIELGALGHVVKDGDRIVGVSASYDQGRESGGNERYIQFMATAKDAPPGSGKRIFVKHLEEAAKSDSWIRLLADPKARGFWEHMGMELVPNQGRNRIFKSYQMSPDKVKQRLEELTVGKADDEPKSGIYTVPDNVRKYDPDQPRDDGGKWTDGGTGGAGKAKEVNYGRQRSQFARSFKGMKDPETLAAWDSYKGYGFNVVNYKLRGEKLSRRFWEMAEIEDEKQLKGIMGKIDDTFQSSAAVLKEDVVLYRGFNWSKFGKDPEKLVGVTIKNKGYTSTTSDEKYAKQFSMIENDSGEPVGAVMRIRVPKGTRAVPAGAFGKDKLKESEMVLDKGAKVKVVGMRKVGKTIYYTGQLVK